MFLLDSEPATCKCATPPRTGLGSGGSTPLVCSSPSLPSSAAIAPSRSSSPTPSACSTARNGARTLVRPARLMVRSWRRWHAWRIALLMNSHSHPMSDHAVTGSTLTSVRAALEREDDELVLRLTDALLAERPGDDAAHEYRARALLAIGRLDEAERHAAGCRAARPRRDPLSRAACQSCARGRPSGRRGRVRGLARNDPAPDHVDGGRGAGAPRRRPAGDGRRRGAPRRPDRAGNGRASLRCRRRWRARRRPRRVPGRVAAARLLPAIRCP